MIKLKFSIHCVAVIVISILTATYSSAQRNEHLLNSLSKTIDYFKTKNNGKLFKVNQLIDTLVSPDGISHSNYQFELESGNRRLFLPKNENYIGSAQNIIYTYFREDLKSEHEKLILKSNLFDETKLIPINEILIDEPYSSFYPLAHSKSIFTTNEWEGFGTQINLYSNKLQKLSSLKPFGETGFVSSITSLGDDKLGIIFFPVDKQQLAKLVMIDAKSGNIDFQKDLDSKNYKITTITSIGDFLVITQHKTPDKQELLCFNNKGDLLWRKNQYVYAIIGLKINNIWTALCLDKENYWFIAVDQGNLYSKKSITDLISTGTLGKDTWIELQPLNHGSQIGLLVSKFNNKSKSYIHSFSTLSSPSDLSKQSELISKEKKITFKGVFNNVILKDSNNKIVYTYEK